MRPIVLPATLTELPGVLATQAPDVRFDRILGRNALVREPDKVAIIHRLAKLLRHSGYLCWRRRSSYATALSLTRPDEAGCGLVRATCCC